MQYAPKTTSIQAYHMLLYRKAVHPELFAIESRRRIERGDYEFESWVFRGGHTLLFSYQGLCVSEIVTERTSGMPERAQIAVLPCAGERDFEERISDRIEYITSVQTETLPDHLYRATFKEMLEHAEMNDGLMVAWDESDERLPNLSVVDMQRYHDEMHIQAYHFRGDCALVLRSQTIFRVLTDSPDKAAAAEASA